LNRAWEVEPARRGMIHNFLMKRVLSFALILGAAALLLASLVVQTVLSTFGALVAAILPEGFAGVALRVGSLSVTLVVATLLFGALFHILPDARVHWRDAWRGALSTGLLFMLGNVLLGVYLSRSEPG